MSTSANAGPFDTGMPPGSLPCSRCGELAAAGSERDLILGSYYGPVCGKCRPGCETEVRRSQLKQAGVPKLYLEKMAGSSGRPMPAGRPWLLLLGPRGCGKTHAAVEMLVGRPGACFAFWPEIVDLRRMHLAAPRSADDPLPRLKRATGLLLIDDLGAERVDDYAKEAANLVVSARYHDSAPTIITSNLSLEEITKCYGDRLGSRISEAAQVMGLAERTDRRLAMALGALPPVPRAERP